MHARILKPVFLGALAAGLMAVGCEFDDVNINIEDANVTFNTDVDTSNIVAGDSIPVTIEATDVFLIDPAATPPPEQEDAAGHLEFHLDTVDSVVLLVTAETSVSVPIPADTPPGNHKLLCRLMRHDGTPTTVTFEIDITVVVVTGAAD